MNLSFPVPEGDVADDVLKAAIPNILNGDHYFHLAMQRALTAAGFAVASVERFSVHPIYEIRLQRGQFDLAPDERSATRQIRRILKRARIVVGRDAFHLIRSGKYIKLVFLFPFGAEGRVQFGR